MKKYNNKSGFTLIEIIVVMIIIGILAAIALPNIFANITRSQGVTAVAAMDGIKDELETCCAQNNTFPSSGGTCSPANYGLTTSNGFTFSIATTTEGQYSGAGAFNAASGSPSGGTLMYSILAVYPGEGGAVIALNRATNGTFSCSAPAEGVYAGVC